MWGEISAQVPCTHLIFHLWICILSVNSALGAGASDAVRWTPEHGPREPTGLKLTSFIHPIRNNLWNLFFTPTVVELIPTTITTLSSNYIINIFNIWNERYRFYPVLLVEVFSCLLQWSQIYSGDWYSDWTYLHQFRLLKSPPPPYSLTMITDISCALN